jgi:hypothetical protein
MPGQTKSKDVHSHLSEKAVSMVVPDCSFLKELNTAYVINGVRIVENLPSVLLNCEIFHAGRSCWLNAIRI